MNLSIGKLILLAMSATILVAADATGKWRGELVPSDGDGSGRPAYLVLKQDGSKLTGTAGPNANEQEAIQNGKAEDGTLTFELPHGEFVMTFRLKQDGEEISGIITREREGTTQQAKLAVKRER